MALALDDLRYSVRALRRTPLVAALATTCVGLAVAVATATFSLVDGIIVRALPFPDSDRFVNLGLVQPDERRAPVLSYPDFQDWRDENTVFSTLAGVSLRDVTVSDGRDAVLVHGALVTADLLPLTGVQPALGRSLLASDDRPGADPVVVISDDLWRQRFDRDPRALGQPLRVDGRVHAVIGVMPRRFAFPFVQQLWMPLEPSLRARSRGEFPLFAFARLGTDVTLAQASSQMADVAAHLARQHQEHAGWLASVQTVRALYNPPQVTFSLLLLLAAGGCVLLIACANVANLTLARAITRHGELTLRVALGAGRTDVIRLMLVDGLLLALGGLPLGLALAKIGIALFDRAIAASPSTVPYTLSWALDARVVAFAGVATLVAAAASGVAAAWHASRGQPQLVLTSRSAGAGAGGRGRWLRDGLVVAQVAVTLVLLAGAGLFLRSFLRSYQETGGIDVSRVVTMRLGFPDATYPEPADIARRVEDIVTQVEQLPGVAAVTASPLIPLLGGTRVATVTQTGALQAPGDELRIRYAPVTAGFFSTIGVAPIAGRSFERAEGMQRSGVAIVNAAMVARVWPKGDAVGRQFQLGDAAGQRAFRVVGVVPNFNHEGVVSEREAVPAAYVPLPYGMDRNVGLMVRAVGDPTEVVPRIRDAIRRLDADVPMTAVRTMVRVQRDESWAFSFMASAFAVLGGIALVLAAVGVFGVLAYTVSQRTAEVGIRMALGARGQDVVRMFLRQGAVLCGGGVLLGLSLSLLAGPILQRALYQVSARDPVTLASISLGLLAIGLLASYLPARRAARVDPMRTLRSV